MVHKFHRIFCSISNDVWKVSQQIGNAYGFTLSKIISILTTTWLYIKGNIHVYMYMYKNTNVEREEREPKMHFIKWWNCECFFFLVISTSWFQCILFYENILVQ